MVDAPIVLSDVNYADVVVVGRVSEYNIIETDPAGRPTWNYARFVVDIDEVLVGSVPDRISVTWDNSTFELPLEMSAGPFLIALRLPSSATPPLRGPSATVLPNRDPDLLAVLQAPCADPFIFEQSSEEARSIRELIAAQR